MDEDEIPDIGSYSVSEILTVLLIIAALLAAFTSAGMSIIQPFNGFTGLALTLGLVAIAMAVLSKQNQS